MQVHIEEEAHVRRTWSHRLRCRARFTADINLLPQLAADAAKGMYAAKAQHVSPGSRVGKRLEEDMADRCPG